MPTAARGPWTRVSATRMRAGGKRVWIVVITSRRAAASLPVTRPIRRGKRGRGRLRAASKSPSSASACFRRSIAARCAPSPKRSSESARSLNSPFAAKSSGRPSTWIRSPSARSSLSASKVRRGIEAGRLAPSAGSLSVKKTLPQRSERRSSVTSPSIHSVGSRCEPVGDAAVEACDGVDLPVAVEQWFDLHPGRA